MWLRAFDDLNTRKCPRSQALVHPNVRAGVSSEGKVCACCLHVLSFVLSLSLPLRPSSFTVCTNYDCITSSLIINTVIVSPAMQVVIKLNYFFNILYIFNYITTFISFSAPVCPNRLINPIDSKYLPLSASISSLVSHLEISALFTILIQQTEFDSFIVLIYKFCAFLLLDFSKR